MYINKAWMYNRLVNGFITDEYFDGVEEFVNFAKRHPNCMNGDKLRCPCNHCKCRNTTFRDEDTVKVHICKNGFVPNYYNWYCHGEPYLFEPIGPSGVSSSDPIAREESSSNDNAMQSMVYNTMNALDHSNIDPEIPTSEVQKLYDMLKANEREVWEDIPSGHSQLSVIVSLLNIKAEHHFSEHQLSIEVQALRQENQELRDQIIELKQSLEDRITVVEQSMEDRIKAAVERQIQEFFSRYSLISPSALPTPYGFDSRETQDPNATNK